MHYCNEALEFQRNRFDAKRSSGERIACSIDSPADASINAPAIIIAPAFGKTRRDYAVPSWYLLRHGFQVVRYDNTFHVGESDGEIYDFTIQSAAEDLTAVLEHIGETLRPRSVAVVAPSLAFRSALRALRNRHDVALLFSLVGVVNLRSTLREVCDGRDFFAEFQAGELSVRGYTILGHEVATNFVFSAVQDKFEGLDSTVEDLRSCKVPIVHVAGESDSWVDLNDVQLAFSKGRTSAKSELFFLPGVHHDLSKNPVAAALALQQLVISCSEFLSDRPLGPDDVLHPTIVEIVRMQGLEPAQKSAA